MRTSRWADWPLARKFALLLLSSGAMTALVACVVVAAIGWRAAQSQAFQSAAEVADLLALSLEAPVAFDDAKSMRDALDVVGARRDVRGAWVWDTKGRLLSARGAQPAVPVGAQRGGLADGVLEISRPIGDARLPVGHVSLRLDLSEYRRALLAQGLGLLGALVLGVALSLVVALWLARRIARPIVELADAAGTVAEGHDYEHRLPVAGRDEIGRAIAAFNAMIEEVRERGDALERANRSLEDRVAERTVQLEAARARAEAASVAKTRFLANMSHELRTPLNGVIGAAQLLRDQGDVERRHQELIDIIRASGSNLLGLVDSVLDLARIESGAMTLVQEDFNLAEAADTVLASAAVAARQKGLQLSCDIDPSLALWRHGDALRLRQVLLNLLGNAVKFTLRGEVEVRMTAEGAQGADGVRIEVRDTGIGMSDATLATAFEPFRQADDGSTRRFGGSGLGLAICREVVTLMGGSIEAASAPQGGSTFTVRLPLPVAATAPQPAPPLGYRVAFIEPHGPSARALRSLLLRMGCEPLPCPDAPALITAMAQPDARGRAPWLLVATDDASGRDLLEQCAVHVDPERVIGMTAAEWYAADAARERLRLARNVTKPVLRTALASRFGAVAPGADAAHAADDAPLLAREAARVLVVEDDTVNQTIVATMLARAGLSVEVAADGQGALRSFAEMRFDLVLMDWQMPDMDGLEVTRRLRAGVAGARGHTVPIVALTANAFAEDRLACLEAGMNDFLTKPVVSEALVRTVNRWIGRRADAAP